MNKSFNRWIKDYDGVFKTSLLRDIEHQFGEFDPQTYIEETEKKNWDRKSFQMYVAYRNEVTTKKLVLATWVLAIGTLILSGLTILLTFLT